MLSFMVGVLGMRADSLEAKWKVVKPYLRLEIEKTRVERLDRMIDEFIPIRHRLVHADLKGFLEYVAKREGFFVSFDLNKGTTSQTPEGLFGIAIKVLFTSDRGASILGKAESLADLLYKTWEDCQNAPAIRDQIRRVVACLKTRISSG